MGDDRCSRTWLGGNDICERNCLADERSIRAAKRQDRWREPITPRETNGIAEDLPMWEAGHSSCLRVNDVRTEAPSRSFARNRIEPDCSRQRVIRGIVIEHRTPGADRDRVAACESPVIGVASLRVRRRGAEPDSRRLLLGHGRHLDDDPRITRCRDSGSIRFRANERDRPRSEHRLP